MTTVQEAQSRVDATAVARAERLAALEAAEAAKVKAESAFLESDSPKVLDEAVRARLRHEKATALHDAAEHAHACARAEFDSLSRKIALDALAVDAQRLANWRDALGPLADRVVAADREIDLAAVEIARVTLAAAALHASVSERASRLGVSEPTETPAMDLSLFHVRQLATAARETDGRADVHELLTSLERDWKLAGLSPAQILSGAQRSARLRAEEARAEAMQQGADLAIAHFAAMPPPPPATPEPVAPKKTNPEAVNAVLEVLSGDLAP